MFTIITPTYKRIEKLERTVASVIEQSLSDWEMLIVNDSPEDESYHSFLEKYAQEKRIRYIVNDTNRGVNFSRNKALDLISPESSWIIFLDDDDYFAEDVLQILQNLTEKKSGSKWFLTNRAYANGESLTKFPKNNREYSYIWDYLILKQCKGDATHCISRSLIKNLRFSRKVKQGEEWFFFYQIGLQSTLFYHNHNSTLSDGYDTASGLNFRVRTLKESLRSLYALFTEGVMLGLTYHFTFLLYLLARLTLSSKILFDKNFWIRRV